MKVKDIAYHIEKLCPKSLACEWDNVGLLIGNAENEVTKILVTLDVDIFVVREAIDCGANLIVSHHPLMFNAIRRLTEQDASQKVLMELVKNDISLYSAHTNLDVAPDGLNDFLAKKLGFADTEILDLTGEYDGKICGFGRIFELDEPKKFIEIVNDCKNKLNLCAVRYCGDDDRKIKRIAVNSGGGTSSMNCCFEKNVDLFITGDFKYNVLRDACENNLAVIDAGHYNTEVIVKDLFFDYLSDKFGRDIIIKSRKNIDIVKICE